MRFTDRSQEVHQNIRTNLDAGPRDDIKDSMRGIEARGGETTRLGHQYNDLGDGTAGRKWQQIHEEARDGAWGNVTAFGAAFGGQMIGAGFRVVGEFAGDAAGDGGAAARGGPKVGFYKDMSGKLPAGSQANHLNQDAAFGDAIPSGRGLSVEMQGDAIHDVGSQHYKFHQQMEGFWEQYRDKGNMFGQTPTNSEYDKALSRALRAGGFSKEQTKTLVEAAGAQRRLFGLKNDAPVPRIPGRLNQVKDQR